MEFLLDRENLFKKLTRGTFNQEPPAPKYTFAWDSKNFINGLFRQKQGTLSRSNNATNEGSNIEWSFYTSLYYR